MFIEAMSLPSMLHRLWQHIFVCGSNRLASLPYMVHHPMPHLQFFWRIFSMGIPDLQLWKLPLATSEPWVAKPAGFPDFLSALICSLVPSYGIPSRECPRREAAPLPLSFFEWMEDQSLRHHGTTADRWLLGAMPCLVWASLRWSDGPWVSLSLLQEDSFSIRGVATRTKTTTRSMPFGLSKFGLLGDSNHCWGTTWLNLVRAAFANVQAISPRYGS